MEIHRARRAGRGTAVGSFPTLPRAVGPRGRRSTSVGSPAIALLIAVGWASPGAADTIRVGPDRDLKTIEDAIDSAGNADSILVDAGDYFEMLVLADKALILAAADPTQPPIVRLPAGSTGSVLTIEGEAVDSTTVISDFIFRGGKGWLDPSSQERYGGALMITNSASPLIRRCTADSSIAEWGAGIAAKAAGKIRLERCAIDGCVAALGGGGLYLDSMDPTRIDSLTVTRCMAEGGNGGGVLIRGAGGDSLAGLLIRDNEAESGGGVAVEASSPVNLSRSVLARNLARSTGGGVHLGTAANLNFVTVDTCTAAQGGGIRIEAGGASIRNSIVTRNVGGGVSCAGGTATLDYNDVWGNTPDNLSGCTAGSGSISADPRYVDPDSLDLRLTSRSPAIDAADPLEPVPVTGGLRADMGAFEFRAGPDFIALDPTDPDLIYKNGNAINFQVEWETDSTLTVAVTADFSGVDDTFSPERSTVTVTPLGSGATTRFRFAVRYTIAEESGAPDGEGILIPVTATTSLGGATTVQVLAVTLDNTPPPPPQLASLPKSSASEFLTVFGSVDVAAGADSVTILVNDLFAASAPPNASGIFTATARLADRVNQVTATAFDRAGNESNQAPSQTVTFVGAFFIEFPKRFRAGDAFTIGSPTATSTVEIRIVNLAGQLIRTITGGGGELVTLEWDGLNEKGNRVNAGPYIVRVLVDVPGQARRTEDRALILVRGEGGNG